MGVERLVVRLGVPLLLVGSCAGAVAVSWHTTRSEIPGFALGSHVVLAVQVALLLFYGALLLLVPLVRALSDGDLPVELSLRGARWKEGMRGIGGELLVRQANAENEAFRIEAEVKEGIHRLKDELEEVEMTQEGITDGTLRRIKALEKAVGAAEPDAKLGGHGEG